MSDGALQVLDGTHLLSADTSLPEDLSGDIAADRVLQIAESRASDCLYSLSLPEFLKSSALKRLDYDVRGQVIDSAKAERLLRDYISAIADELRDEPIVVSVLDGNTIRLFLEDEDDFAMLAENLFTDLDAEDEGKLSKSEIRNALVNMGVEMGVPPLSDFPMANDILKKHGAEGEEKLGQAQFAQLLQPILQELADALALEPVTVVQNVKITNGSKLRKLLADKNQLGDVTENMYQQTSDCQKEQGCAEVIRSYLEKNGNELGLPPLEANETVILLYDAIFSDIDNKMRAKDVKKNELGDLVRQILEKFAAELQANPVFHDVVN
ncbi:uncharacterized protein LOC110708425 [Chenopodium quinoa]|uniref:uncharacterized protein LOC110708425 n=1 Tax=Chenopodium quinoa TaxID=63459 RepID=UPI000B78B31F|nr:uncharacterized protein LOC110708425 [Chenopodium quinoa]